MVIKIARSHIWYVSIFLVLLFLVINRLNNVYKSHITDGVVIGHKIWENETFPEDTEIAPIVEFYTEDTRITFTSQRNLNYEINDKVNVIYKEKNPHNANIYSFYGFWLEPLILSFIPITIISALIFAFISKKDIIEISRKSNKKIHIDRKSIKK